MFTSRARWNADELAARLEITERTLRRDVNRLRDLGYPVESTTGRYGGYQLGPGGRLPPLLLDDDEAVAVSVALHDLSRAADPTFGESALSASAKLRQVLPSPLSDRVDALTSVMVGFDEPRPHRADESVALPSLMLLAVCSRRGERVSFAYVDNAERRTDRRVEPHRLVSLNRRWYLVGFDLDRDDWRTYRVDRIAELRATGHRNTPRETPDAATQVAEGVAVHAFSLHARVRVFVPLAVASRSIGPTAGAFEPTDADDPTCVVRIGGDADWIARYLVGLPFRTEVIEPDEVRAEVRKLARRLLREHAG